MDEEFKIAVSLEGAPDLKALIGEIVREEIAAAVAGADNQMLGLEVECAGLSARIQTLEALVTLVQELQSRS